MRLLIIEDRDDKFLVIERELAKALKADHEMTRADNFSRALKLIYEQRFDAIIIDLMVPLRAGEEPQDITDDVIETIELSEKNRGATIIALSAFTDLVQEQRAKFTDAGAVLIHYREDDGSWRKGVAAALSRIVQEHAFDFVIICALDKERKAYSSTAAILGDLRNIRGMDCQLMHIGSLRGVCIKLPGMGLVDSSVITSRAIERFNPNIVTMSGICAGSSRNAVIGTLVVADPCWEYQAGKWAADGFQMEHYDVCLDANVKTCLSQFITTVGKGEAYKKSLLEDPVVFADIVIAPMATGSAVIASQDRMKSIEVQHRKIAALDMEMYGVYKSAQLSAKKPYVFGAKAVVDLANNAKGDDYHEYGSVLSARFVVGAIECLHKSLVKPTT